MLKAGSILLTIGSGFNFLLAASILVALCVFRKSAPMLFIVFDAAEIPKLDSRVLGTTKALAILFNSCAAALSLMTIFVVWCALAKRQPWAFWALLLATGLAQAMGFVADAAIGTKTLIPNLVLTGLFLVGIGLSGYAVFRS